MRATIYYDGECPFCMRYAQYQRLQKKLEQVDLVDLRTNHQQRQRLQAEGFNLDQGMVLDLDGQMYTGTDAAHRLALLSTNNNTLSRINRFILGSHIGAALLYPLLRLGRNATLLVLDREPLTPIENDARAWQTLFCMAWGLFAYLHVLVYAYQFGAPMWLSTWAIAPLGAALFLYPQSRRIFLLLLLCLVVDAWRQMPSLSNHTILKNIFLSALLLSGAWHALRGSRWQDFLADAAPVGRSALICMYIFGVFHKINSDFLNPDVSCAVVLWQAMPPYLAWLDAPWFHHVAIYGTLVIETIILIFLLFKQTRHAGIIFGIGFHGLLAMSGYALYAPFSTLTIALHLLFLEKSSALRIVESPFWQTLTNNLHSPKGFFVLGAWLAILALMAWQGMFSSIGVMWLLIIGVLCYAIARYGKAQFDQPNLPMLWSRLWWLNALSILFFLNCFSPYLGLKTAQSMNMFANLRLEAGTSNHLVFRNPPQPFGYLADTVELIHVTNSNRLQYIYSNGLHLTYYDLLDKLDRDPQATVSYRRANTLHVKQNSSTLSTEIETVLHPRWVRNFFHFNAVDLTTPKPCALDR